MTLVSKEADIILAIGAVVATGFLVYALIKTWKNTTEPVTDILKTTSSGITKLEVQAFTGASNFLDNLINPTFEKTPMSLAMFIRGVNYSNPITAGNQWLIDKIAGIKTPFL